MSFPEELQKRVEEAGIIAVAIVEKVEHAVPMARALLAGGVSVLELTLRTPAALPALEAIAAEVPGMLVGAGTVLSPAQVRQVKAAGAAFGVAPGVNRSVLEAAAECGLPFAPGIATPSDIEAALEHGCTLMKLFPAETVGGLPWLKAIAAPYLFRGVRFIPLGGLHPGNMQAYLAEPLVAALGGSWLAPREALEAGDWDRITALATDACKAIATARRTPGHP